MRQRAARTGVEQPILAVDGKTARRSHDRNSGLGALHSVSIWASEFGLSLGQVACAEKSNEITAIPELLRLVDIKGAIITIDAMGTQKAIAAEIIKGGADYVLALKVSPGASKPATHGRFKTSHDSGWFRTRMLTLTGLAACSKSQAPIGFLFPSKAVFVGSTIRPISRPLALALAGSWTLPRSGLRAGGRFGWFWTRSTFLRAGGRFGWFWILRRVRGRSRPVFQAVAPAGHLDDLRVMEESIQDRRRGGDVSQEFTPVLQRPI